jgi:C4-type Zn-finger protein
MGVSSMKKGGAVTQGHWNELSGNSTGAKAQNKPDTQHDATKQRAPCPRCHANECGVLRTLTNCTVDCWEMDRRRKCDACNYRTNTVEVEKEVHDKEHAAYLFLESVKRDLAQRMIDHLNVV